MTYQSVWWHPNYVEYGTGLNPPKTWPHVYEQYRRPNPLQDLRHYDLPTENYTGGLYQRLPRLGQPVYRGTFRDKPFTHTAHYPNEDPKGKATGFFGRVYYEDGPLKNGGPAKDDLYWLERPPYLPSFPKTPIPPPSDGARSMTSSRSGSRGSPLHQSAPGSRAASRSGSQAHARAASVPPTAPGGSGYAPAAPGGSGYAPATPSAPGGLGYTHVAPPTAQEYPMSTYKSAYVHPSTQLQPSLTRGPL